jgi:hypothetical protein
MLLLKSVDNKWIDTSLLDINDGTLIVKLSFTGVSEDIEFLEQFNQKIFIKLREKNLKIYNMLTEESIEIKQFQTPEAFIFLYE